MTDEQAPAPTTPEAPPPSLLQGAASIEPGVASDVFRARLAEANPLAGQRTPENARLYQERVARWTNFVQTRFGAELAAADGGPLIAPARHFELARALKEELGYRLYVTVCASHWPAQKTKTGDDPEHFEVATVLRIPGAGTHAAAWRVRLTGDESIESLVPLFAGADFQEREQFDLVGVRFRGHPDLRRLMLPDEWEGHPLRKDYAIDTRCVPWR